MESFFLYGIGKRSENLDRFSFFEQNGFFFVVILDAYETSPSDASLYFNELCEKLKDSCDLNFAISHTSPTGVKASLIASKITDDSIEFISVGDCRIYINGCLVTEDNTLAWDKLSSKGFEKQDLASLVCRHPRRHILNSIISVKTMEDIPHSVFHKIEKDDVLTFASDGGWEVLNDFFLAINHKEAYEAIKNNRLSFPDNYSVICLEV